LATTIATIADMKNAGNLGARIDDDCLTFYLELVSYMLRRMLGDTNYDAAVAGTLDPAIHNDMIKKAEALMATGFALPALGTKIVETGMLKIQSVGSRGGEIQVASFAKEVMELAANFINMGQHIIPDDYIVADEYKTVWYQVMQRVFPALDELPTMARMHSAAEAAIKRERGDKIYEPEDG